MPVSRRTRRWIITFASAVSVAAFGTLAALLWRLGLDEADQLASVLSLFVGISSLSVAVVAIAQVQRASRQVAPAARPGSVVEVTTAWGPRRIDDPLRQLLISTERACDTASNPLLGERRTEVSTIYVRQRVEQPRERPRQEFRKRKRDLFLPIEQEPHTIAVRRTFAKAFDRHRHLYLEGGPGTGKSTTARQVCRQLAAAWLDGTPDALELTGTPLLPLLVSARGLAGAIGLSWTEKIASAARLELAALFRGELPVELLDDAVDGVPWMIVVDGIDEVPGAERDAVLDMLAARTGDAAYRFLITSRPLVGHATSVLGNPEVGHYTLMPFDAASLREFTRRWFTDDEGEADEDRITGFLTEISASGMADLAAVPLMATIAISVYQRDPRHRLPRSRYDLYDLSLARLRQAGRSRRTDARSALLAALEEEPHGEVIANGLYRHLDDLLESMATVRVSSRDPLLPVALDRLRQLIPEVAEAPPPDWDTDVLDALITTGAVVARSSGLDFIHLSFAEHLAARVHARELSAEFDPENGTWQRWIDRAVAGQDPVAMRVLISWTHNHDPSGLLDWLLTALREHRLLAVRLVGEGTDVSEPQLDRCLVELGRTSLGVGVIGHRDDKRLLRSLPPSGRLSSWLYERLAASAGQPQQEVLIAQILAEREPGARPDMVRRIRRLFDDDPHQTTRMLAANALHELAGGRSEAVVAALRHMLGNGALDLGDQIEIASSLLQTEGEATPEILNLLESAVADNGASSYDRRRAAELLVEADSDRRAQVLGRMRDALSTIVADGYDAVMICKTIISLAPHGADDAIARLWSIFTDTAEDAEARSEAFRALLEVGGQHRQRLVAEVTRRCDGLPADLIDPHRFLDLICAMGDDVRHAAIPRVIKAATWMEPRFRPGLSWRFREHPKSRQELQERLHELVVASPPGSIRHAWLAISLAGADIAYRGPIASALEVLLTPPLHRQHLVEAISNLGEVAPSVAGAIADRLVPLLASDESDLFSARHVSHISWVVPGHAEAEEIRLSWEDARDARTPADQLSLFGRGLAADPRLREAMLNRIIETVTDRRLNVGLRFYAIGQLRRSTFQTPSMESALREFIADDAVDGIIRHRAAWVPWMHGTDTLARHVLTKVVEDPFTTPQDRADALGRMLESNWGDRHVLLAELGQIGSVGYNATKVRANAFVTLAKYGYSLERARAHLLGMLAAPHATPGERCLIATGLASITMPETRTAFARTFITTIAAGLDFDDGDEPELVVCTALMFCPERPAIVLRWALWALEQRHPYTSSALVFLISRVHPSPDDLPPRLDHVPERAEEVDELLWREQFTTLLGPDQDPAVAAMLRRWLGTAVLRPEHRLEILRRLIGHDVDDIKHAVDALRDAIRRPSDTQEPPTVPPLDPLGAANHLYTDFITERAAAIQFLSAVANDPAEARARKRTAREIIRRSGGPRALRDLALLLETTLADPRTDLGTRIDTALELTAIGSQYIDTVVSVLRPHLGDRRPAWRLRVAETLLAIDRTANDAATALCALAADRAVHRPIAIQAARTLNDGGPPHKEALVTALRRRLRDAREPREVVWLHDLLGEVLPAAQADAVTALRHIAANGETLPRIEAAAALLGRGEEAAAAQHILAAVADDAAVPGHLRVLAGRRLAVRPGPYTDLLTGRFLMLPGAGNADRVDAAVVLLRFPGEPGARAGAALRALAVDPGTPPRPRLAAAEALAGHRDPAGQRCARSVFADLCEEPSVHPYLRCRARAALGRLDPTQADKAVAVLWEMVTTAHVGLSHRCWAAEAIAELSDGLRRPARDALAAADGDHLDARARRRLHRSVALVDGRSQADET
ncbi:hypothetical protein [Actinoplanes aureus]|uniref:AAA+ ATPase domain-containing protein n=1 Tax=Actinoplanes aureus TaxID=2792083 RepID=A0A931FZI2_9ACTN|nr:hypothetical protein [Actinoplanes aureus]MBG0564792.1 hypothetical protein [Actinoplanes aureus]